ncbi:glycosyl hydrolase [Polaribacter sp. IC066]|nr:glycosyl hydrolase [Polaribacter sp. IC063]TXD60683.1 glycosyl hydrolase [Polaribacter sp. IC066]
MTYVSIVCSMVMSCSSNKETSEQVKKVGYEATIYTTAHKTNLNLTKSIDIKFGESKQYCETAIFIDPTKQFQSLLGIGGALTDASAETFFKLPEKSQNKILESYFDAEKGIGYSLGRTSIHSSDFGSESFSYVKEGDKELTSFSIEHDQKYRLPFIKKAISKAGGKLTFYASPWSPPAFMKTNNSMLNGGKLKPEYYQPWANYYAKFIKAYEKEGIPIWGLTIQNEPMAVQVWESCIYTAEEERDFLKNYLGPTLEKEGLGEKKIIVWDHNRDILYRRASVIFNDPEASKYAWGAGFHWYEDWKDGVPMYNEIKKVNEAYPDKKLLFTEGCNESYDLERLINDDHKLAERYGKSMINDFNNGTVGWTDWNILLDHNGGPNHVGNLCFSPVHADTRTGEVTFTRSFYYIGHFSKFIRPGAKRIANSSNSNQIISTAFINPDGSIAVVVLNQGDSKKEFSIEINSKMAKTTALPYSIQTIVLLPVG